MFASRSSVISVQKSNEKNFHQLRKYWAGQNFRVQPSSSLPQVPQDPRFRWGLWGRASKPKLPLRFQESRGLKVLGVRG